MSLENKEKKQEKKVVSAESNTLLTGFLEQQTEDAEASTSSAPFLTPELKSFVQKCSKSTVFVGASNTGKTDILLERVRHLLSLHCLPEGLFILGANRQSAVHIEHFLESLGEDIAKPRVDTFEGWTLDLWLQNYGELPIYLGERESIHLFRSVNASEPEAWILEGVKGLGSISVSDASDALQRMHSAYTLQKKSWNLIDFSDLLEFWENQVLIDSSNIRWEHILVDDLHLLPTSVIRLLSRYLAKHNSQLFATSCDMEDIFYTQDTSKNFFLPLIASCPSLQRCLLRQNYKSGSAILSFCNELSQQRYNASGKYDISASRWSSSYPQYCAHTSSGFVHLLHAPDEQQELSWIAKELERLVLPLSLRSSLDEKPTPLNKNLKSGTYKMVDICIALRKKENIPQYFQGLTTQLNKFFSFSSSSFSCIWSDPHVLHLLSLVKPLFGVDLESDKTAGICPSKVIFKGPLSIRAYLSEGSFLPSSFWESEAFYTLDKIFELCGSWPGVLTYIGLHGTTSSCPSGASIAFKSYEELCVSPSYPVLFLPGLQDGFVPYASTLSGKLAKNTKKTSLEEEQSLLLQVLGKAEKALLLSYSHKCTQYPNVHFKMSRFLEQIAPEVISFSTTLVSKKAHQEQQLSFLRSGS